MQFLNPWLLLGAAGISIPILIHLLNRLRRRRIDWAAMELLRRVLVRRSRQIHLEDILLLVLRCMAILLLALAMAQPTLTASGARWFGSRVQAGAVVAVDGSYSMTCRPGVSSRFDHAAQSLRDIVETLEPGSPVSLVLMGRQPHILLRNTDYDARQFDQVIENAQPLPDRLNVEACLEQLDALVREVQAPARECYIVTDAQAVTWSNLSERARRLIEQIGSDAALFLVVSEGDIAENLALDDFSFYSGALRKGATARYVVQLRNFGQQIHQNVIVTLYQGENAVDRRVIDRLGPGETQVVPLFAHFETSGEVRLTARLDRDAVAMDNVRHAVAAVQSEIRILCVDGTPSDRPFGGATGYLATALVPKRGRGRGTVVLDSVAWLELPTKKFADYDIVILANVPDLRDEQVKRLFDFVQRGGGLMYFAGGKIRPEVANMRLRSGGTSLLPAELLDAATLPSDMPEGWPIQSGRRDHPLARLLSFLPAPLLAEARVRCLLTNRLLARGEAILKVGDKAGTVLLAEHRLGNGKVLLFTTSADREWTDLPTHPLYPILLNEATTYLTRPSRERSFAVGEPLVVSVPPQSVEPSITFHDPTGKEAIIQVTQRDGRRVAVYDHAEQPGFYEARFPETGSLLPARRLAVNVDPSEGDVRTLNEEELTTVLAGLPVHLVMGDTNLAEVVREVRVGRPLWRMFMLAALVLLALEAFLAYWFSKRLAAREETLEPTGAQLLATEGAA